MASPDLHSQCWQDSQYKNQCWQDSQYKNQCWQDSQYKNQCWQPEDSQYKSNNQFSTRYKFIVYPVILAAAGAMLLERGLPLQGIKPQYQ